MATPFLAFEYSYNIENTYAVKKLLAHCFSIVWLNPVTAQPLQFSTMHQQVDTTENFIDFHGNYQSRKTANFVRKFWPQDGKIRLNMNQVVQSTQDKPLL